VNGGPSAAPRLSLIAGLLKKGKPRTLTPGLQTGGPPSWLGFLQNRGFPSVAAAVIVLVMAVVVGMLVSMCHPLVAMLVAIVAMGNGIMRMLVLMLVFAVAAHPDSPPFRWPASFY
jgi:hypothetical protein